MTNPSELSLSTPTPSLFSAIYLALSSVRHASSLKNATRILIHKLNLIDSLDMPGVSQIGRNNTSKHVAEMQSEWNINVQCNTT